jgi:hypothetical protein
VKRKFTKCKIVQEAELDEDINFYMANNQNVNLLMKKGMPSEEESKRVVT